MGSLHPATRYNIDRDYGALGHSRRADIVMLDDNLNVHNTWLGGELVVENKKITSTLEQQLGNKRYKYPNRAYNTVILPNEFKLIPDIPNKENLKVNIIKSELPGIMTTREIINVKEIITDWKTFLHDNNLCHLCVVERHGHNGEYAHGFLKNFNLKHGAVASSVGHDAHNIIVAGMNESDMKFAIDKITETQGGIVIVNNGNLIAKVELPIAGLLSDKRANIVAEENKILKDEWKNAGCTLPYMGFNLLPLSVIPNFRITNKGLVDQISATIILQSYLDRKK